MTLRARLHRQLHIGSWPNGKLTGLNVFVVWVILAALLVGIVRFMLVHTPAVTSISADTLSALVLASTYAAFASMLLHCRHVAYICNDAPDGM